jgi:trimeric autotransporter adhesin
LAISLNKDLVGLNSVETIDGTKKSTMTAAGTTVTDGTNTTIYGADGLNINGNDVSLTSAGLNAGGVTVSATGIDANNQLIKNVANAKDTGDATNLGQVENLIANASEGITNLGFSLQAEDGKAVTKKLGEAIDIVGDDQNISTAISEGKISVILAKDIVVDSINAGGSILNSTGLIIGNTKVNSDGIFVTDGPSLSVSGISAGNKTISNVANGVNRDDAINKGQFDDAINGLSDSLGDLTQSSVMYDKNADGSVNKNSITLGGENGTLITNVADGRVEIGSKDAVNGGQLANVRDNLQGQITNNTNTITELQNNLASGTIGLVQQQEPTGQIGVAKDTGGLSVNFAGTSGNRVLTGVEAGRISQDSNDAVTGAQLNTNYENIANSLGGNAKFENGTWIGPSYIIGSGDDQTVVNNVGDAVSALNEADQALNMKVNSMGTQFDDALRSTNERIDKLSTKTNAAIAAAIAIASLPQPTEYGSSMLALGTGVWEGETGLSIGASGVTTEKKIFNHKPVHYVWKFATTTNSRGHWGGGASVGIQWK